MGDEAQRFLIVLVGPSGVGKGTLARALLARAVGRAVSSISATTRSPRAGEEDGVDYFFKSRDEFEHDVRAGFFVEHAEFSGNRYGTPRAFLEEQLARGRDVLMDIDIQGARQLMEKYPEHVFCFIRPPSFEELEARLRGRGTDPPDAVARRLETARWELDQQGDFPYSVVNDEVARAVDEIRQIVENHRRKHAGG